MEKDGYNKQNSNISKKMTISKNSIIGEELTDGDLIARMC